MIRMMFMTTSSMELIPTRELMICTITNNKSYNNNHGIICSVACYNMHITNNELYNNQRDGIFMDAGSHHSTIANNIIYNEDVAIQLPSLSYSQVYGNIISNSNMALNLKHK